MTRSSAAAASAAAASASHSSSTAVAAAAGAVAPRFRQKKLSTKATLAVVREDASTKIEDDQQRNIQKIETGVEKGEEVEHHLQAAIKSSQAAALGRKGATAAIPTPHTEQSSIQYDRLYSSRFSQPATYIRFSSTVEDCSGPAYCMTTEDDDFFNHLGAKRIDSTTTLTCSEDTFEQVMTFFEETAAEKQPYASVDSPPVVEYQEFEAVFDETLDTKARAFAQDIYGHWKSQRLIKGNHSLLTSLKFETGAESDDADPYICFRRREVRQVRKTRGRDAQSADKLKALRLQLEEARQLVTMVKQREHGRGEVMKIDREIFDVRTRFRGMKRGLKNSDLDEELLINQKPPKKKPLEQQTPQSANRLGQPRMRPDGRPADADLVTIKETWEQRLAEIQTEIANKVAQHEKWNVGFVDNTRGPMTPTVPEPKSTYRTVSTQFMPTPPASISSTASPPDTTGVAADDPPPTHSSFSTPHDPKPIADPHHHNRSYASPSPEPMLVSDLTAPPPMQFRRRIGRGGRIFVDRRGARGVSSRRREEDVNAFVWDRNKYDQDDDEDEDSDDAPIPYHMDPFSPVNMRYRASVLGRDHYSHHQQQSAQHQQQALYAQAQAAHLARASKQQHQHQQQQQQGADVPMANGASTAGLQMSSSPPRPESSHRS